MKKAEGGRQKAFRRRIASVLLVCLLPSAFCLLVQTAHGAWSPQRAGTLAWLRAVHFTDASSGWAVGGNGALLATADGGATWRAHKRPNADTLRDVFFVDQSNGWLVCERSVFALASDAEARSYLLRTVDGGDSWSRVEVTRDQPGVLLTRVAFADASRGWAFGEMGALYSTADGGATWSPRRTGTRHILLGASFVGDAHAWLVGTGGTVLLSEDGGAEWRAAALLNAFAAKDAPRLHAVSFADAQRGWAVGRAGIVLATADGGRTWSRQDAGTESDLTDVKFLDAREGWAVGDGGTIIHTADGGRTWRGVPSGTRHRLERLSFPARSRGWAVGFGGTIVAYTGAEQPAPRLKSSGGR